MESAGNTFSWLRHGSDLPDHANDAGTGRPCDLHLSLLSVPLPGCRGYGLLGVALASSRGGWLAFRRRGFTPSSQPNTKLVVCNFPHNPTGFLPTLEEFQQFLEITTAHGVRFFSDEIFRLSECDPQRTLPAAVELNEHAISLAAMSKVYGLAGLRLGWLAMRDRPLIEQLAKGAITLRFAPAHRASCFL